MGSKVQPETVVECIATICGSFRDFVVQLHKGRDTIFVFLVNFSILDKISPARVYKLYGIVYTYVLPQVFHVPLEERRYQYEELSFGGETRQSEIVREIQEKTGCDIEMTQVRGFSEICACFSFSPPSLIHSLTSYITILPPPGYQLFIVTRVYTIVYNVLSMRTPVN